MGRHGDRLGDHLDPRRGDGFVGGLGYLLDRLLDTGSGFTALGIVLGAASAIYIVYLRYGKEASDDHG